MAVTHRLWHLGEKNPRNSNIKGALKSRLPAPPAVAFASFNHDGDSHDVRLSFARISPRVDDPEGFLGTLSPGAEDAPARPSIRCRKIAGHPDKLLVP